jgi:Domain of unknown function (DUF4349)
VSAVKAVLFILTFLFLLMLGCGGDTGSTVLRDSGGEAHAGAAGANSVEGQEKLVIESTLALEVQGLREAYESIKASVRAEAGFVADSGIHDTQGRANAVLRLRLPASRHEDFLSGLRGLPNAKVLNEETRAQEVAAEFTDLQSRLVNLERTEAQYQALLARSVTIDEVLRVSERLNAVRGRYRAG